jgi:hypothetical protein
MSKLPALLDPKSHFVTFIQTDRKHNGIIQTHVTLTTEARGNNEFVRTEERN